MLNLASELEASDFTPDELETVKLHIKENGKINFTNMHSAWRDQEDNLCIAYECDCDTDKTVNRWWHYSGLRKEWW